MPLNFKSTKYYSSLLLHMILSVQSRNKKRREKKWVESIFLSLIPSSSSSSLSHTHTLLISWTEMLIARLNESWARPVLRNPFLKLSTTSSPSLLILRYDLIGFQADELVNCIRLSISVLSRKSFVTLSYQSATRMTYALLVFLLYFLSLQTICFSFLSLDRRKSRKILQDFIQLRGFRIEVSISPVLFLVYILLFFFFLLLTFSLFSFYFLFLFLIWFFILHFLSSLILFIF